MYLQLNSIDNTKVRVLINKDVRKIRVTDIRSNYSGTTVTYHEDHLKMMFIKPSEKKEQTKRTNNKPQRK